jgi:hypothetical protein
MHSARGAWRQAEIFVDPVAPGIDKEKKKKKLRGKNEKRVS